MKRIYLFLMFLANIAFAHPHAFVDLQTKALVENKTVTGFQMHWTLDEIASSTLIYEIQASADKEAAKKKILDEMIETAKTDHYFSYFYNQKNELIKFTDKPTDYDFGVKENRIVFTTKIYLEQPQQLGKVASTLMTYEPTYYMGMYYNSEKDLSISQMNCKIRLVQPKVDQSLQLYANSLDKNQAPEDNSLGRSFAQKVEMLCD